MALTDEGLSTAFGRADTDRDGRLDLVGFILVLEDLGMSWGRQETQHRFETADANRDGLISFAELQALLDTFGP